MSISLATVNPLHFWGAITTLLDFCESHAPHHANVLLEIMKYLNQDLSDDRLKRNSYKDYLNAVDHNHNHTVIKKLKKKIIHYLPYAEIGKPYKTSDWLKK